MGYLSRVAIGSSLYALVFILEILTLDNSYIARLIALFFSGFSASAEISLSQLMLIMTVPKCSRGSTMFLAKFVSGIVSTPSAQLIGFLSDKIRGNSTLETDRFRS
ncbi:hypothetical protein PRIPAC_77621, partial [Pristionchus pacificus]